MRKFFYILLLFITAFGQRGLTQDALFSQYYSAPLYLAPSFAGGTKGSRLALNYRNQWPGISTTYSIFSFSYDHFFPQYNSGLGLIILKDVAGTANLNKTNIGFQYSYKFRINRKFNIRPGISFQMTQLSIDFNKLVFYEQLTFNGIIPQNSEVNHLTKKSYLDLSFSTLFYTEDEWAGITIDHLNKPEESLESYLSPVPTRFRIFGGKKFYSDKRKKELQFISTNFVFKKQGSFSQFDIGGAFFKAPFNMGLAYRGIPFKKNFEGFSNHDAIILLLGYVLKDLKIGYSYDLTISRLAPNSWGSHEISIVFLFLQNQIVRHPHNAIIIPCAKF